MGISPKIIFKNLKFHVADAIKESCYKTDARLYNIANGVHDIGTFGLDSGVEVFDGLLKIIDKTIIESVSVGCDLSVIVKGILLGAFRASPFVRQEAPNTFQILITETLRSVFKYKGDVKEAIDGVLAATIIIASEYKLNVHEALIAAKGDILSSLKNWDPKIYDEIKEILSKLDD